MSANKGEDFGLDDDDEPFRQTPFLLKILGLAGFLAICGGLVWLQVKPLRARKNPVTTNPAPSKTGQTVEQLKASLFDLQEEANKWQAEITRLTAEERELAASASASGDTAKYSALSEAIRKQQGRLETARDEVERLTKLAAKSSPLPNSTSAALKMQIALLEKQRNKEQTTGNTQRVELEKKRLRLVIARNNVRREREEATKRVQELNAWRDAAQEELDTKYAFIIDDERTSDAIRKSELKKQINNAKDALRTQNLIIMNRTREIEDYNAQLNHLDPNNIVYADNPDNKKFDRQIAVLRQKLASSQNRPELAKTLAREEAKVKLLSLQVASLKQQQAKLPPPAANPNRDKLEKVRDELANAKRQYGKAFTALKRNKKELDGQESLRSVMGGNK